MKKNNKWDRNETRHFGRKTKKLQKADFSNNWVIVRFMRKIHDKQIKGNLISAQFRQLKMLFNHLMMKKIHKKK